MSLKTLQMIMKKAAKKKTVIIMPGGRYKCSDIIIPWVFGLGLVIGLWILFGISTTQVWIEEYLFSDFSHKLFPVYLHISCSFSVCLVITILTYLIFYRQNFGSWFSTLGFLFYVLAQLIMIANDLTMQSKFRSQFCIESVIMFVFTALYTQTVSWQYRLHREELQRLRDEYVERQLALQRRERGKCVTIPLTGPSVNKLGQPIPGPSSRR